MKWKNYLGCPTSHHIWSGAFAQIILSTSTSPSIPMHRIKNYCFFYYVVVATHFLIYLFVIESQYKNKKRIILVSAQMFLPICLSYVFYEWWCTNCIMIVSMHVATLFINYFWTMPPQTLLNFFYMLSFSCYVFNLVPLFSHYTNFL
jgi:hypothetical protein